MQSKANGSDPSSKIVTLKNAVKCFYESVAQLKTNGTCSTATSGNGVNSSSQIRFGFVPYTTNVNVGRLLPSSYFANSWPYQSREIASTSWGSWYNTSISCGSQPANSPTHQYQTITSNGSCKRIQERDGTITWRYFLVSKDITGLKNGSGWNNSFQLPINDDGTNKAISWDGCMEERKTIQSSGSPPAFTINSSNQVIAPNGQKMNDLDIDMLPSQSDSDSLWGPALTDIIYTRLSNGDYGSATTSEVDTTQADVPQNASYSCPTAAKKMQAWPDPAAFDTYVDSLATGGNTYHDIGLLWGARLMSPTGLFASENALTPQGGQIQRHMIFMTDGDTQTDPLNYTAYGVGWYDRRQTPSNTTPTGGSGEDGNLTQQVNGRFAALCTATKNKGITLWVISFGGSGIASQTKARLQACATDSNHYFDATSAASLDSAFQLIAAQITQLRLTK